MSSSKQQEEEEHAPKTAAITVNTLPRWQNSISELEKHNRPIGSRKSTAHRLSWKGTTTSRWTYHQNWLFKLDRVPQLRWCTSILPTASISWKSHMCNTSLNTWIYLRNSDDPLQRSSCRIRSHRNQACTTLANSGSWIKGDMSSNELNVSFLSFGSIKMA